jgi:hypothetical protein
MLNPPQTEEILVTYSITINYEHPEHRKSILKSLEFPAIGACTGCGFVGPDKKEGPHSYSYEPTPGKKGKISHE